MGLVPAGAYQNRSYAKNDVMLAELPEYLTDLVFDPQTSGGLLASVEEKYAEDILHGFAQQGLAGQAAVIGRVLQKDKKYLHLL